MSDAPGWQAIEARLASVYGEQQPKHWGTIMRYSEGGPDPLDGISAYSADDPPHWHYVTFGFSELYQKTSKNLDESGWGFELSLRLLGGKKDKSPPEWPVLFLQKLARYVFNTGNAFDDEHYIAWGGPVTSEVATKLAAVVFSADPVLGAIKTPNGKLKFLRVIGATAEEHAFAAEEGPDKLLALLLKDNQLGVVDLKRKSVC
jgi:hypothetical protein